MDNTSINTGNVQDAKENSIMDKRQSKCRINAHISKVNYKFIDDVMAKGELIGMKLSKGAILDLALTNLFMSLDSGESLDVIAINHIERANK